jgi:hypothetical protein
MPGQILTELPDHYQPMFSSNWEYLLSQKDSRFENAVSRLPVMGKERYISQLDDDGAMRPVVTRNGQTVPQDTDTSLRVLRVKGYDAVTWIDEWDELSLKDLPAPQSEHVNIHAKKAKRTIDDIIIAAIEGTVYGGVDGTTALTVGNGQKVAVNYVRTGTAVNSGMTLAKLIRAKRIADENEWPDDGRYIAMKAAQFEDLLADVDQVSNSRYSDVKALVDGSINRFMGFTFIRSERLTVDSGTDIATCLCWHKSMVVLGDGQNEKARIDILPTQNHSIQIRTTLVKGATRKQEEGVILIYADQSP